MRLLPVAAAVLALGLVAGCSSDDDGDQDSGLPPDAELATYFDALASFDPDQLAEAGSAAADGSPAQAYAGYLGGFSASAVAAGQPYDAFESKQVDGGYEACAPGSSEDCIGFGDLQGEGGELTDFTVDGTTLDDALVDLGDQAPVESPGLYTVQPDYAFLSPQSGSLNVVVTITAGDVPLSPRPGIYIEQDQNLNGAEARAPKTIEPGDGTPVVLTFPDADGAALDGSVTFGLKVGGTLESIGFGLTAPAS